MEDHSDHNEDDSDFCQQLPKKKEPLVSGDLRQAISDERLCQLFNVHVKFHWSSKSDRDPLRWNGHTLRNPDESVIR